MRSMYIIGRILNLFIVFGMLAACTAPPGAPEIAETATQPPAPAATDTASLPETAGTQAPTHTASATLTATATEAPPDATPELPATLIAMSAPQFIQTITSPDGSWRAEVLRWDCAQVQGEAMAYEELRLIQVQDGAEQVIDSQLQNCGGLGAAGLGVVFWPADGRYLYYTPSREGQPDGLCWYWHRELIALETESGQKTRLQQGPLSPDESTLAFWDHNDLVLWDLAGGETARLTAAKADLHPGPIAWAPDGQSLAYIQNGTSYCAFGESALVRVDLPGQEQTVLIESEDPSLTGVEWEAADRFHLEDVGRGRWTFDVSTQTLAPAP